MKQHKSFNPEEYQREFNEGIKILSWVFFSLFTIVPALASLLILGILHITAYMKGYLS